MGLRSAASEVDAIDDRVTEPYLPRNPLAPREPEPPDDTHRARRRALALALVRLGFVVVLGTVVVLALVR